MIIGGYTLHPGVIWEDEFTQAAASQSVNKTLLNNVVIYSIPDTKLEFNIVAADSGSVSRGYFTREQIVYFKHQEQVAATIVLTYRDVDYNVIVKAGGIKLSLSEKLKQLAILIYIQDQ